MKFISKISKQGEDYFIRIPRDQHGNELHEIRPELVRVTLEVIK